MNITNDVDTRIWYGTECCSSYSIPYISWLSHAQLHVVLTLRPQTCSLAFVIIDAASEDVVEDLPK